MNFWMNSAPRRRAPVPDRAWTVMIRFSLIAEESVPRMSSRVTLLYSASPSMGRYSLLYLPRLARSAWETQQGEVFSQRMEEGKGVGPSPRGLAHLQHGVENQGLAFLGAVGADAQV